MRFTDTFLQQWKSFYLVLRPNLLSIYKNSSEERLHKQISLSDLTAVALLKDPKGRREHVFGLFSPERNFHFQARDEKDCRAWVELIKREARIDEEHGLLLGSSVANAAGLEQHFSRDAPGDENERWEQDRLGSSSPELIEKASRPSTTKDAIRAPAIARPSTGNLEYSGDDYNPHSDFSDTPPPQSYSDPSFGSFIHRKLRGVSSPNTTQPAPNTQPVPHNATARNVSQASGIHVDHPPNNDDERVVWHGYLLCLKSKGGVRQWKRLWAVLRPKNLAFYKDEQEYAARLIIPLSNIIDAVEIDPVSRTKFHCMQVIAEEQSYRFCAPSEEALARWLGALKSQLARRREGKAKGV